MFGRPTLHPTLNLRHHQFSKALIKRALLTGSMRSASASAHSDHRSNSSAKIEAVSFRKNAISDGWTWVLQVGPKVSDCNDRNGLSRKCGNISPLKRNGYFERFPHQRWRTNGERRSSVLCGLANPHNGSTTVRFDSDHSITVEESPDALALLAAVEGTICQPSPKGLPSHAIAPNHLQQSKRLGHRNVRNCPQTTGWPAGCSCSWPSKTPPKLLHDGDYQEEDRTPPAIRATEVNLP